jgi:glutaredoxin
MNSNIFLRIFWFLAAAVFSLFLMLPAEAATTNVYFFYGDGCPHCAKEEKFLDYLETTDKSVKVNRYEVWGNKQNQELLTQAAKRLNLRFGGVPVTVVGSEAIVGFDETETTGVKISALIKKMSEGPQRDIVGELLKDKVAEKIDQPSGSGVGAGESGATKIQSFFGEIDIKKLSLPALTAVIGLLDSLNPCAMWVLLFLLSLLLVGGDRKRMLVLGGGFIFASAFTYFLFLSAWLNVYQLIGLLGWLKMLIIAVAIFAGGYNLREYWRNRKGGCEIKDAPKRQAIMQRLRAAAQHNSLLIAFIGVVSLASVINLIELLCSAGLPAIYVPVLTQAGLPQWQYYSYLLLYVFFYVFPQLAIFLIAFFSLRLTAISSKVTKWSNLFGGIIMIILGIWLLIQWY